MKTQDQKIELPKDLEAKIIKEIQDNQPTIYWDYNDSLSEDQINTILTKKEGIMDVENEIWEMNIDYICDLERETIKNALGQFENELRDKLYTDYEEYTDVVDIAYDDFMDDLRDYVEVDFDFDRLLNNTGDIPVRIQLYSNYDCINSNHYEGSHYRMDEYFGDMINTLNLNPRKVKQTLLDNGFKVSGAWRNKSNREGKELIKYSDLPKELINSSCGANLLVFVAMINLKNVISGLPTKFVIPKGNKCGLFSSTYGGGSMIDMELIRDFKIDTTKTGNSEYDHLGLVTDSEDGYSIDQVYGVCNSFWGNTLKIIK